MAGRKSSTPTRVRSSPAQLLPACSPARASPSAWTAKGPGGIMCSSNGCGAASNTRRYICEPTKPSARRATRSADISTFIIAVAPIRVLTAARRIKPTSPRCRSVRQPNPGRRSTYRRGDSVQTTGTSSLDAFVIVRLDRRDLVWINVTANPTAEWVARQITEAFPWDEAPRYLIRDHDRIYGSVVTRRLRAMGIRDKPTAPASPWQNGFAERLIGSIRRECVDHIIVLGEAHLCRILRSYADYYNGVRTHRSLNKDAPIFRPVQRTGSIKPFPILGGLHHHYVRI